MGYFFLTLTILLETGAILLMKLSSGFAHKWYALGAMLLYALSFVFLTLCLKRLPAGTANAIWAGTSAVLVAVLGVLLFKEKLATIQVISLLLIVAGLVGLNVSKA
jgi:multidrug transporter EmrE-like cation transporter